MDSDDGLMSVLWQATPHQPWLHEEILMQFELTIRTRGHVIYSEATTFFRYRPWSKQPCTHRS